MPASYAWDVLGIYMLPEVCSVSCEDSQGNEYTISMDAKAWVENDAASSCGLDVYEKLYENGNMIYEVQRAYHDPASEERNYGGYIYSHGDSEEQADDTTFTRGIMSGFLGLLNDYQTIWKIFYASEVQITKSDNIIYAQYNHKINSCPVGTYVQIHAMCDAYGGDADEVAIGCRIYHEGTLDEKVSTTEVLEENTFIDEPSDGYTYLASCYSGDCTDECETNDEGLCEYDGTPENQHWGRDY